MADLVALKASNEKRWKAAKLTRGPEFKKFAQKIFDNKSRYEAIQQRTGVHWLFVACSHYRESTLDFTKQLGQGDPLNQVSTRVPAGRGPFKTFEDSAYDALVNCAPYAARLKDWSIGGMLTNLERFNGLGYANRGVPSAYVWSGTDQYVKGKYVADGVYDPSVVDKQLGVAGLILAVMAIDPSIKFESASTVLLEPSLVRDGEWLQESLNTLGATPSLIVDGVVGPATRNALRSFQLAAGITVDGLTGPQTFAAIDKALASGKPVVTMPVPPDIILPPPGTQARTDLESTFWGRVLALFKPKAKT